MKTFRLYLGRTTDAAHGHVPISNAEVEAFELDTIDQSFDGYIVFDGTGKWKGKSERTTIVEIVADVSQATSVRYIAAEYTRRFHQDAVLVTSSDATTELIESLAVAA